MAVSSGHALAYLKSLSAEQRNVLFSEWRSKGGEGSYVDWVAKEGMRPKSELNASVTKNTPTAAYESVDRNAPTVAPEITSSINKNLSDVVPSATTTQGNEVDTNTSKVQIDTDATKEKPVHVTIDDPNRPGTPLDLTAGIFDDLSKKTGQMGGSVAPKNETKEKTRPDWKMEFFDRNNPLNEPLQQIGKNLASATAPTPNTPVTQGKTEQKAPTSLFDIPVAPAPGYPLEETKAPTPASSPKEGWGGLIYELHNLNETEKKVLEEVTKGNNKPDTSKPMTPITLPDSKHTPAKLAEGLNKAAEVKNEVDSRANNQNSLWESVSGLFRKTPDEMVKEGKEQKGLAGFGKQALGRGIEAGGHALNALQEGGGFGDILNSVGSLAHMIPGVGGAIGSVLQFGGTITKLIPSLKRWTEELHRSNMEFAEFSGSMARVSAEQDIRDMQLSRNKGEARAESAQRLAESKSRLAEAKAPMENVMANFKNDMAAAVNEGCAEALENGMNKWFPDLAKKEEENQTGGIMAEADDASEEYWKNHQRPARMRD